MHGRLTQFINNQQKESDTKASAVQPKVQSGVGLAIQPLTWLMPAAGVANKSENVKAARLPTKACVCMCAEKSNRDPKRVREAEGTACSNKKRVKK